MRSRAAGQSVGSGEQKKCQIEGNFNKTNKFIVKIFRLSPGDWEDCNKNAIKSKNALFVCTFLFWYQTQFFLKSRDHRRRIISIFQFFPVLRLLFPVVKWPVHLAKWEFTALVKGKRCSTPKSEGKEQRGANENKIKFFIAHIFFLPSSHTAEHRSGVYFSNGPWWTNDQTATTRTTTPMQKLLINSIQFDWARACVMSPETKTKKNSSPSKCANISSDDDRRRLTATVSQVACVGEIAEITFEES